MIDDPDLFRAAELLVEKYRDNAGIRAAQRANKLAGSGNIEASALWRQIVAAIEELQHGRREGELLN
jgi:hypothetical protein